MAADRYVVLGLARARSGWFREVARWATTAVVPLEFVMSMTPEEVRARLATGRTFSALLVDDASAGLDRDLVELARQAGCAVVVVSAGHGRRSWVDLGASAVLAEPFGRDELLSVLAHVATPIGRSDERPLTTNDPPPTPAYRGHLVAVTGPGGTGASTLAMGIAQGLARDPSRTELVCLADLALHAEQAMLHDARDVVPGVAELVEAHRTGDPDLHDVRDLTWSIPDRGYHLLLGLRRHRDWTAIRPRAFDAALRGLLGAFRVVVADIEPDFEGDDATGSTDVEDRNAMARATVRNADVVVVVGTPGTKGLHSLLRTVRDVVDQGTDGTRVIPVVNRAPRGHRARAELTTAVARLLGSDERHAGVPAPVYLAERRHLDDALRDAVRMPDPWHAPVTSAVVGLLERAVDRPDEPVPELVAVRPGSLGHWTELSDDGDDER